MSIAKRRFNIAKFGSGPSLWVDFNTLDNVTEVGGNISSVADRVSGATFSQSTAGNRPNIITGVQQDRRFAEFDGNDFLDADGTAVSVSGDFGLVIVLNDPVLNQTDAYLASDTSGDQVGAINGNTVVALGGLVTASTVPLSAGINVVTVYRVSTSTAVYVNQALAGAGNAGSNAIRAGYIGASNATPTNAANADIAEIVLFDHTFTANEISLLNDIYAKKYGVFS